MADLKSLTRRVTDAVNAYSDNPASPSRQSLLDSIEKLRIAALGPAEYTTRLRYQPLQNMCMGMAIEMGLLQTLAVRKNGSTITAEELAKETKSDKLLTVRIMRMLTAINIGEELGPEVYASNPNSDYLARPSSIGAMKFMSMTTLKNMANVVPYMRSQGGVFHQFPDRSQGQISAAEHAYGMPLWELFRADPECLADFTAYLSGRREGVVSQWFDIFPAAERLQAVLKNSQGETQGGQQPPLIVDVGGNVGYDLQSFKRKYPEIEGRYVLQDLAENIDKAKSLLEGTGIESMKYDFFTPQPIKGSRIYYFGGICHDWPDDETKKLLSNTVSAMSEDSLLLIDEQCLPDANAPLSLVTYDVLMMLNVCGIERTIGHYRGLLDEIGLELVKVWTSPLDSVLETRLKKR